LIIFELFESIIDKISGDSETLLEDKYSNLIPGIFGFEIYFPS